MTVNVRELTLADLGALSWRDAGPGWFVIVADLTCSRCGAYQAADSDPVTDKNTAASLCLRLFNKAGWRVDGDDLPLCPECAKSK